MESTNQLQLVGYWLEKRSDSRTLAEMADLVLENVQNSFTQQRSYVLQVSETCEKGLDCFKVMFAAKCSGLEIRGLEPPMILTLDEPAKVLELEVRKDNEPPYTIRHSDAIAQCVARWPERKDLCGETPKIEAEIRQWIDRSSELEKSLRLLKKNFQDETAMACVKRELHALDAHLRSCIEKKNDKYSPVYLVGGSRTLADIMMVSVLACGYSEVLPNLLMVEFRSIGSYFQYMINQVEFKYLSHYNSAKQAKCPLRM